MIARERRFAAIVFGVYAAITLAVALHHEPWRDEADPWLLVRDGGISTMLARTGYAGMPALWYLALAPLVKLGLPYVSMTLLNLAFAWAAALVFLVAAPFPRYVRALFVFSYFLSYEYAAIARPYALAVLLLFAALASWRWPMRFALFVALLANTTPHMLLIAAILGALYLRERPRRAAIAIMLAGGLLSAVQLLPPRDAPQGHVLRGASLLPVQEAVATAFFPRTEMQGRSLFAAAIVAAVSLSIGARATPQIFLWASLAALSFIYAFIWMGGARHAGLLLIVVIATLWLAVLDGRLRAESELMALLAVPLAISCLLMPRVWLRELREPFSGAAEMASWLERNGHARARIAAHAPNRAQAVLPYLDRTFFYPARGRDGSYMTWDAAHKRAQAMDDATAARIAREHLRGASFLLLLNAPLQNAHGFQLLHATARPFGHRDEQYFLYAAEGR
ncbi:MAG TPA: hypothetical protein VF846_04700 [Thermoanaerobaculia bacterium]|jgi:hypothetical protein